MAVGDSLYGRTGSEGRLAIRIPPGTHRVTARKGGFRTTQTTAQLAAGGEESLSFELRRASSAESPALGGMADNFPLLFLAALIGLAGIVAAFIGIAGWKQGVFTRWLRDATPFDRYDVLEVLRRSEFTTVYLANDPPNHREVALTVLDDPYADRPDHVEKFFEKGHTLEHIHEIEAEAPVIEVYRVARKDDEDEGRPFIAHEYLTGDTLLSHLKEVGRLDTPAALATIRQVCIALRAAHDIDVHHGAVSPENIIVTQKHPHFEIKLVGFGLGAQQPSTQVLTDGISGSTAAYVAPEQIRNGRADQQANMYAVGMLFYKLVTGTPPYAEDDATRVLERQEADDRPEMPDHIPDHVKPVFYRMISTDPDRRPNASRAVSVLDLFQSAA